MLEESLSDLLRRHFGALARELEERESDKRPLTFKLASGLLKLDLSCCGCCAIKVCSDLRNEMLKGRYD